MATIDEQVGASADDSHEALGSNYPTAAYAFWNHAAYGVNECWAAMRWQVTIPAGATIDVAYAEVYVYSTATDDAQCYIQAEDIANAPQFTSDDNNISNRTRTTAQVAWEQNNLGAGFQQTPELKTIIQELVDDYDYSGGSNYLALIARDNKSGGKTLRTDTYDDDTTHAAKLHIEYTVAGPEYKKLAYTSEPPTPNAWNQLKQEAGTGWKKLLFEGE